MLPFAVDYEPYTGSHVLTQLQLLVFSALAFSVLMRTGVYPPEMRLINLDSDWVYRRIGAVLAPEFTAHISRARANAETAVRNAVDRFVQGLFRQHGPHGVLASTWPTGSMVLWVAILLAVSLVLYYV